MADTCAQNTNTLIFSCSGGSDVGGLSDRMARKLAKDGKGKMYCLAGIGAGLKNFIETSSKATLLAIDGCPVGCAGKIMENAKLAHTHINLFSLGYEKGKTNVDEATVAEAIERMGNYEGETKNHKGCSGGVCQGCKG